MLLRKLGDRSASIGVVGLGDVGLPLALRYAEVGYPVIGFDIDTAKVQPLNAGRSYIEPIPHEWVNAARAKSFGAITDVACAAADALICKKNVGDTREAPSVKLMKLLAAHGASADYSDPYVPEFPKMREHQCNLKSVALNAQAVASYDVVLLVTDHDAFDDALIRKHARLIVDTRGVYLESAANVVKA